MANVDRSFSIIINMSAIEFAPGHRLYVHGMQIIPLGSSELDTLTEIEYQYMVAVYREFKRRYPLAHIPIPRRMTPSARLREQEETAAFLQEIDVS